MTIEQKFVAPGGKGSLDAPATMRTLARLEGNNIAFNQDYPGDSLELQPIHTVYGGAHLFKSDTALKLSKLALEAFERYVPDWKIMGLLLSGESGSSHDSALSEFMNELLDIEAPAGTARLVHERVGARLKSLQAVQDLRIDFEDGYGSRADEEEDAHAEQAASELALAMEAHSCPPFVGIRIKSLSLQTAHRSVRTLDIFVTSLIRRCGRLPDNFVVTLPKVVNAQQVNALNSLLGQLEMKLGLSHASIRTELMVETAQSIVGSRGEFALRVLIEAGGRRLRGLHFGTYDYTASLGVSGPAQSMGHPACDFARQAMLACSAGTGLWLSDGATVVMPVPPHKKAELSPSEELANHEAVLFALSLACRNTRDSLRLGFYQGWDLHPAQLVARYASSYAFFLESLDDVSKRLAAFVNKAAQATLSGSAFDDAATGQGLLNFMLRGVSCGAFTEAELLERSGLSLSEIRARSFPLIIEARLGRR